MPKRVTKLYELRNKDVSVEAYGGTVQGNQIPNGEVKKIYTYLRTRVGGLPLFTATTYTSGEVVVWTKYGSSYIFPKGSGKAPFSFCAKKKIYLQSTGLYI